ncbi:hypothetical protein B0H14DRAFT_3858294 [Mycena olivaceomarginata]|nr:hypothetical protein B0H14DRAFT_3858294 [Mycena olivaceomarginata]
MPSLPEASLSIIASDLPVNSTPWVVGGGLSLMIGTAYYASPQRLTRVLVDTMADVKKKYLEAVENGVLCASDAHTAGTFSSLQLEVSTIRQASLHSSLSHYAMLCDFLKGRTFSILRCIHELHELGTHIEILKESQRREITSRRLET